MNFVPRSQYKSISLSKIPQERQRSIAADSIESRSIDFQPHGASLGSKFAIMSNTMLMQSAQAPNFYLTSNCEDNHSVSYAQKVQEILNNTKS